MPRDPRSSRRTPAQIQCAPARASGVARAVMLLGFAAMALAAAPARESFAEDPRPIGARGERYENSADRAALAELGLDLAEIEKCEDVAKLWRAVRELAVPGRVSEATHQRLLRRVFAIDPDIRHGSRLDSQVN